MLDTDTIETIAKRSYSHPNGYDKIVLVSRDIMELPYELRMHVWWADQHRSLGDIHNHDWEFSSRVLCGRLDCQEYEAGDYGEPMLRYIYLRSEKARFILQAQGSGRLKLGRFYSVWPGQSYSMQRTTLHRAAGAEGCTTATLILQGPTHQLSSMIYRDTESNQGGEPSPLEPLPPSALRSKLQRLADILEQNEKSPDPADRP
jgi:hypothetical protein